MQENLSPEEIQAQQKREEELNKSMLNILQELCTAQKNLALAKGAQAKKEAQKTVNDITNQIGEFVKNASNGYTDRKGKINDIKQEYEEVAQCFADSYRMDMDMYNIQRQELEAKATESRLSLAEAKKEKNDLENTPIYKAYIKMVKSCEAQIARAAKAGNLEEVNSRTAELENYQKDFAKSTVGQQYNENQSKIAQLKADIIEAKDAIKQVKEAEKEAKEQFKFDKKEISGEKNNKIAKIEKQSKLKALVGRITAKFSGEKGFNKRVIDPIKSKLEAAKNAIPKIKDAIKNRQIRTLNRVTGITSKGKGAIVKGKDIVVAQLKSLTEKAAKGVRTVTTKISATKEAAIRSAKNKLLDSKEKATEKLKAIEHGKEK